MARVKRDASLGSKDARLNLKVRKEPYWSAVHRGLHLGYAKGKNGGAWIARVRKGERYHYERLGKADDHIDADGQEVLSFAQAQRKAIAFADLGPQRPPAPYTISRALDDYLEWYEGHRKALKDTQRVVEAHIRPRLGDIEVAKLTTAAIRKWHRDLASAAPRLRSGKGKSVNTRSESDPRARRATANRILTVLKAALNHAWHEGSVPTDAAWRPVRPFPNVDAPKVRQLKPEECIRLINACDQGFRPLVQAALLTGCRYGELTRLTCGDVYSDAPSIYVRESKSGKPRSVPLTDEAAQFFEDQIAGRPAAEPVFLRQDGKPWGKAHQHRPLKAACQKAKISPPASFHILRHTYGSMLAQQGVTLQVIATVLGHADTRITERHYAHLQPSYVAETVRKNLPDLGFTSTGKLKVLKLSAAVQ